jgi:hypothetical protein
MTIPTSTSCALLAPQASSPAHFTELQRLEAEGRSGEP